jgi:hypothetical protein
VCIANAPSAHHDGGGTAKNASLTKDVPDDRLFKLKLQHGDYPANHRFAKNKNACAARVGLFFVNETQMTARGRSVDQSRLFRLPFTTRRVY